MWLRWRRSPPGGSAPSPPPAKVDQTNRWGGGYPGPSFWSIFFPSGALLQKIFCVLPYFLSKKVPMLAILGGWAILGGNLFACHFAQLVTRSPPVLRWEGVPPPSPLDRKWSTTPTPICLYIEPWYRPHCISRCCASESSSSGTCKTA